MQNGEQNKYRQQTSFDQHQQHKNFRLSPLVPPGSVKDNTSAEIIRTKQTQFHSTSSSRMLQDYELSNDLNSLINTQFCESKYGGLELAHSAATKIQRAYRDFKLRERWNQVADIKANRSGVSSENSSIMTTINVPFGTTTSQQKALKKYSCGVSHSQPILRYQQPATSLSSQLRAERNQGTIDFSDSDPISNSITTTTFSTSKLNTNKAQRFIHPPKQQPLEQQKRSLVNMVVSPRLPHRRIQIPPQGTSFTQYHHQQLIIQKKFTNVADPFNLSPIQKQHCAGNQHNLLLEEDAAAVCEEDEECVSPTEIFVDGEMEQQKGAAYHRSQSPALHISNLQVIQLQASPGRASKQDIGQNHRRSPSRSSPKQHVQSFADQHNSKRSVWVPRHFVTGNIPSMHQQQIQKMQIVPVEIKNGCPARTPIVTRSNSSMGACGYQTNSLPRMNNSCHREQVEHNSSNREIYNNVSSMHLQDEQKEQYRRRLYRIALNFFNKKPDRGIQLLIRWGFVSENPRDVARLFRERRGLSKQMIGEFLGTLRSPFHAAVLESFLEEIPMFDMEIDKALRQLLVHFRLPGEAQKIDHIIQAFARRYLICNPHHLSHDGTPDMVYILSFAVIMLNTDLHTPSLKDSRRMKPDEFVRNLARVEEGRNLDRRVLEGIYERVKEFEFRCGTDHVTQVVKVDQSIISKQKPKIVESHRRLICYCRLHQIIDRNKRQSSSAHQRDIFLFNDMMLVCKLMSSRRRPSTSSKFGQYQLRHWSWLIGLQVEEFQNTHYHDGLIITFPEGQTMLFNAKNGDDRYRFVADIRESVAESTEMEQWRLELEMDRQQQGHLLADIGARLAAHNLHLPLPHRKLHSSNADNGQLVGSHQPEKGSICKQHHQDISIGTNSMGSGQRTPNSAGDSIQRDSGLPDMDHTSGHSRSSSPSSP